MAGAPPRPDFELNRHIGIFFAYIGFASLGVAILFQLPSFAKHVHRNGRYGYMFLSPKQNSSLTAGPCQQKTGTVMGNSTIKSAWWYIRKTLMIRIPLTSGLSIGKLLIILLYVGVSIALSLYKNSDGDISVRNYRRFGFLAVSQIPITFALSMKNSPLSYLLGEGYEKLQFLHRLTGRLMFFFSLLHGALYMKIQVDFSGGIDLKGAPQSWGFAALVIMFVMAITGWRVVRERFYQLFLAAHVLGYIGILVTVWKHYDETHPYLAAGIAFLALDHTLKFLKTRYTHASLSTMPGGLTRIELRGITDGWRAGQHVFIRVLSGRNGIEKHPFTIANAPQRSCIPSSNQELVLVAKAAGDFTRRINKRVQDASDTNAEKFKNSNNPVDQTSCRVLVEGPYGNSFDDFGNYRTVFLCAGGIGITYCSGIIEDLIGRALVGEFIATQAIELVWVFRDIDCVTSFESTLATAVNTAAEKTQIKINIRLYLTKTTMSLAENPLIGLTAEFHQGSRPDIFDLLSTASTQTTSLAVGVCGPVPLVDSVQAATRRIPTGGLTDIAIHSERFGW
ncbi:ferric reductase like transmembrane component-domain-containing protein [Melampsora americana]|nr:ferric reductase like transmembrane component-domain-containing protein [Melampsora americana]